MQIVSYEYFGLFVKLQKTGPAAGQMYFIEIEPQKVMNMNPNGTPTMLNAAAGTYSYSATTLKYDYTAQTDTTKTLGIRVRDDAFTTWCPTSTEFKFAQTEGEMIKDRPVYMICQGKETTLFRVTTVINTFMTIPATHPTQAFTKLFSF